MWERYRGETIDTEWEEYLDALEARAEHGTLQRITRLHSGETHSAALWHGTRLSR